MSATAPAVRQAADLKPWTPTFVMTVDDAVEQVDKKREFMRRVMRDGMHYGTIPGTPKPSLWKPGAELLLSAMGLHAELTDAAPPILDFTGRDHSGEALIEYRRACTIYRQIGPAEHERMVIARAEGSCSSWEVKYRYRDAKQKCPECGEETIFVSKKEGGWFCWRAKGGCGLTFAEGDRRITEQKLGRIKNPEVADAANTILKMADKRAFVAAVLLATGCSDIFTQDLSDDEDDRERGDDQAASGRRPNGNSRANGGGRPATSGASDENLAVLQDLNERAGKPWSPALLKGYANPAVFEVKKAELEEMIAKAGAKPSEQQPAGDEEPV